LNSGSRSPGGQGPGRGQGLGGDAGGLSAPAQMGAEGDRVRVYTVGANGKLIGPIWTREMQNGLDAPGVIIVQQLRLAVEKTYPSPAPASKPAQ